MKRIVVSVSGGRTSMFMAIKLIEKYSETHELLFIFANTGKEHPDTLRFLHDAEVNLNIPIVWVEAVVHYGERLACTHKVVNFETASRKGEPFEAIIRKYGIPNVSMCHCTREMKLNPITSYISSIGWDKGSFSTAIGIRDDEKRRVSKHCLTNNIIYPLVDDFPVDKRDVLAYMKQFSWDLRIPEHLGNCTTCYKKSIKKLSMVYKEMPEEFDFNRNMENKYGKIGAAFEKYSNLPDQVFFRQNMSTDTLIEVMNDIYGRQLNMFEMEGSCSESCEMYPTEIIT